MNSYFSLESTCAFYVSLLYIRLYVDGTLLSAHLLEQNVLSTISVTIIKYIHNNGLRWNWKQVDKDHKEMNLQPRTKKWKIFSSWITIFFSPSLCVLLKVIFNFHQFKNNNVNYTSQRKYIPLYSNRIRHRKDVVRHTWLYFYDRCFFVDWGNISQLSY